MIKLVIGLVSGFTAGLVISQVGFGGVAKVLDNQIDKAKTQVEILAK